jgi:hypothetical protein
MVRDALAALNAVSGVPSSAVAASPPSAAQNKVIVRVQEAVAAFGSPPVDLSGAEALTELCASRSYDGQSATIAPLHRDNVDNVALPAIGTSPTFIPTIGDGVGERLMEELKTLPYPLQEGEGARA